VEKGVVQGEMGDKGRGMESDRGNKKGEGEGGWRRWLTEVAPVRVAIGAIVRGEEERESG